jgi:hypothetical protein
MDRVSLLFHFFFFGTDAAAHANSAPVGSVGSPAPFLLSTLIYLGVSLAHAREAHECSCLSLHQQDRRPGVLLIFVLCLRFSFFCFTSAGLLLSHLQSLRDNRHHDAGAGCHE